MIKNNKVLFISSNLSSSFHGGWQCSSRNVKSLQNIFGKDNVDIQLLYPFSVSKKNIISKLFLNLNALFRVIFTFRMNGITKKKESIIISNIQKEKYSIIFIDSSLNGFLIERIKKETSAKIISFFHNCEYYFLKNESSFTSYIRLFPSYVNEKKTLYYSDTNIALNKRDTILLKNLYKYNSTIDIIPISLDDRFKDINVSSNLNDTIPTLLFIGSNFFGNRHGIMWFINKVLPYVKVHLIIVGKDMDKLKINKNKNININIYSNVKSVDEYYYKVNAIIAPIFTGGGMKVKIAESLMFGKKIIGTTEAFEGYRLTSSTLLCNDANDFISVLEKINIKERFFSDSRNLFIENYSSQATNKLFLSIINNL